MTTNHRVLSASAGLLLVAATLGLGSAHAAPGRAKVVGAPHIETYQARMATPEGSPYFTVQRAIVQLARHPTPPHAWTLGVRIFHDYLRPEVHDDLVLQGGSLGGRFVAPHALRQGSYSLYYGLPERQRLSTQSVAVPEGGTRLAFTLELAGHQSGSRRTVGTLTLDRLLAPEEGNRLVFDPFANEILRPTGFGGWVGRAARSWSSKLGQ
jgi:hypothetical protein